MIKLSIYYPNEDDKSFDMHCYSTRHVPMAQTLFGENLVAMSIDKGLTRSNAELPAIILQLGASILKTFLQFKMPCKRIQKNVK